jgi:hypothetical protein
MNIKLVRKFQKEGFTEGKLYINNGFECYTVEYSNILLENSGVKVQNQTTIPKGIYPITISMSTRFKKFLIEVLDVPNLKDVRIYSMNYNEDTDSDIIVSSINNRDDDDWEVGSHLAYEILHNKVKKALSNGEKITLEIV